MFLFLKIFATEFIAEMGDKTQFMMIAMASRYKMKDIIIGSGVAILILNGLAVLLGGLISSIVPIGLLKLIAALAFLFFSITSLSSDDGEEEGKVKEAKFPILAVFGTFFLAEFGDKTQLTAITFAANEGVKSAVIVWLACSIGLFMADVIGMAAGYLMKSNMPTSLMNILAFVLFAVFGVFTLREGCHLMWGQSHLSMMIVIIVTILFVCLCAWVIMRKLKTQKKKK